MKISRLSMVFIAITLIFGLTGPSASEDINPEFKDLLREGLRTKGSVQLERFLSLDATQKFCSDSNVNINSDEAGQLMSKALQQIQYPADGSYLGD